MGVNKFAGLAMAAAASFCIAGAANAAVTLTTDTTTGVFGASGINGAFDIIFFSGSNTTATGFTPANTLLDGKSGLTFGSAGTAVATVTTSTTGTTAAQQASTDVNFGSAAAPAGIYFIDNLTGIKTAASLSNHTFTTGPFGNQGEATYVWQAVLDPTRSYSVEVTGSGSGRFGGNIDFAAAAVPEAATWLMMVGGFGLMGASMRRRQTKVTFA